MRRRRGGSVWRRFAIFLRFWDMVWEISRDLTVFTLLLRRVSASIPLIVQPF